MFTPAASPVAPLRTLDWRFLLPTPPGTRWRRLVVLGGPPGTLARAVAADIADETADVLPARRGTADAVVAYANAPDGVAACAAAVAPNGCLFLEVDREPGGVRERRPGRVEAVLRASGLKGFAWYAVEPDLAGARAYVPLHLPRAMSWHRRTELGDRTTLHIADVVRRSAVRVAGPTALTGNRPCIVVATVSPSRPAPAAVSAPLGVQTDGRSAAGAVMLTYGADRALLFPFTETGREPIAVVKVPKTAALAERTVHEQGQMRALRTTLEASLADAIPEPLGVVGHPGTLIARERYLRGASIASRARNQALSLADKESDLRIAMSWLVRFHRATVSRTGSLTSVRGEVVESVLAAFVRDVGPTSLAGLTAPVHEAIAALGDLRVMLGRQHRDFAAWNVLREGNAVAVVDWEGARDGLPPCDAVHLATTWLYVVRLGLGVDDELRCARELFVPALERDAAASAAWNALMWYLEELQLDRRLAPLFAVAHRLELAVRRASQRRLHGDDAGVESAEARIVRALADDAPHAFARHGMGS